VFHPHPDKHIIKKENIGLIEVMGLAVLPSRLKQELSELAVALAENQPLTGALEKHAEWAEELKTRHSFTAENALQILLQETGRVFAAVLEDAGVYKNDEQGEAAFRRFIATVNG
jgi:UDPglucose--hexose-1-phosphate uridylyltransferase